MSEADEFEDRLDDEEEADSSISIEIEGLSLYTNHGVTAAEREIGQRLAIDLRLDLPESDAVLTDRIEDTVDYGAVCEAVALTAQRRSYMTLERLCAAIAEDLCDRFPIESVWVKAAKPEPPLPYVVDHVAVEYFKEA